MEDYMVRATAAQGQIRCFAATTKKTADRARQYHNTSPVVTAALGRLLTAGAMMGAMMKSDRDVLTLQIRSDGPVQGLTVTCDAAGHVKGYPEQPMVLIPAREDGHLDVGGCVGNGMLYVIQDLGLKEPYVGQIELISGEIADDLAVYYAESEQIPSVVSLGLFVDSGNTVSHSGGYILQLMPDADPLLIDILEGRVSELGFMTDVLKKGMSPEEILEDLLEGLEPEINEKIPVEFACDCSKQKVSKALAGIGKSDLQSMIDDGEEIEVKCHFCNTAYHFSTAELKEILAYGTSTQIRPE